MSVESVRNASGDSVSTSSVGVTLVSIRESSTSALMVCCLLVFVDTEIEAYTHT